MNINHASRRHFLRAAAGLWATAAAHRFSAPLSLSLASIAALASQSSAAAGDAADYRALVCLFLNGGNDSHNWIVPLDATGYNDYAKVRSTLALPQSTLASITLTTSQGSGRAFGMPAELAPLRDLYEAGQAAIVANAGTLTRPTTLADFKSGIGLPAKLFSHNDQASTWQSLSPEGARSGWGGRIGDILMAANANPVFTAVSASGTSVFLSGSSLAQYQVAPSGSVSINGLTKPWFMGSSTGAAALQRVLADSGQSAFQADYSNVVQRSIGADGVLKAALASVSLPTIPPTPISPGTSSTATLDKDPLALQLQIVARLIAANRTLGMRRQIFMVSLGGFDTHSNQQRDLPVLMSRVALAANWFVSAMQSLSLAKSVTLFTASDFGRTLTSNGDGCDHGWGSHHFVIGGAVKGRDIYGTFPITALGTPTDVGSGRLLPTTSVSQHAATLAAWMGVSTTDMATVLPGIQNFGSQPLGYL